MMESTKNANAESCKPEDIILKITNICKSFPGVKALNNVSFELRRGEIHGLVGENGAGKSTLLKILSGVHQADSGTIEMENESVVFKNPIEAQNKGICMEYQERTAFPNLTAGENIVVGHWSEHGKSKLVSWNNIHKSASEILKKLNFDVDTKSKMKDLTFEKQQIVQIARAIAIKGKILILDEPTAAISFSQVENLFNILRMLKEEGYTIIYVSHHLKEVFRITDRVTILKDGETVGTYKTSDLTEKDMIKLMVGRDIPKRTKSAFAGEKEIFSVEDLSSVNGEIQDISFSLKKGEILGVAGLLGSGKELLPRAITGLLPISKGKITIEGKSFIPKSPKHAINNGITVLPAERSTEGLVLNQSISFNMTLSCFKKFVKYRIINDKKQNALSEDVASQVNLKYVTLKQPVNSLSGGNQQRVMIGRALLTDSNVMVLNEPTQGVDVGAKHEIHELIHEFVRQGGSVILVSSELPELLGNSDRILVMSRGRIVAEYLESEATEDILLEQMVG